ncbi:putative transposase [Luteimonas cucumeris]|uniref:Putative transposase n=1 Tax=Luteimonas cucumeris TaxID=985012 RepID=A0A562LB68_9GAMM|nr:transposase [Luteimonas cucumeris]TWI04714.1 putative transposase [Luteimonas cucumeris]
MASFRRSTTPGATWFFTVATYQRQPILTHPDALASLRKATRLAHTRYPFRIESWVVLHDHMHAIWTLPLDDAGYARRWALIKRHTAQTCRHLITSPLASSLRRRQEIGFWQRRFWEHQIRDDRDLASHMDYIHYNTVKHGLVERACDWPHSTFHRQVAKGLLPRNWGNDPGGRRYGE